MSASRQAAAPAAPRTDAGQARLYHALARTAQRLQKAADRELIAAAGISTAQAAVLSLLAAAEPRTQRDLAAARGRFARINRVIDSTLGPAEIVVPADPLARLHDAFGRHSPVADGARPGRRDR